MKPSKQRARKTVPSKTTDGVAAGLAPSWEARLSELELRQTQLEAENHNLRAAYQQLEASSLRRAKLEDHAPIGLVLLDRRGTILDLNRSAAALLGTDRKHLLGRLFTFLVVPEEIPLFEVHLGRCRRASTEYIPPHGKGAAAKRNESRAVVHPPETHKAISIELRLRGAGAGAVVVELASVPVLDERGRVTQLHTTLIDITERKRAEAAGQATERTLRALIDASPHPVWFKDAAGCWVLANAAALELFELTGIDYRTKRDSELAVHSPFYRTSLQARERADHATIETGKISRNDEIVPKPDGLARVIDFIRVPLLHSDGQPKGLVVLGYDITERQQAEAAIELVSRLPEENPLPVMRLNQGRILTYANPAAKRLLSSWGVALGEEGPGEIVQTARTVLANGDKRDLELSFDNRVYEVTFVPVPDADYVNLYFSDITERREAERALRKGHDELELRVRERTAELVRANAALKAEILAHQQAEFSRARLAAIVESSSDAILSSRLDGNIVSWNKGAERLFDYSSDEIIGHSLSLITPPDRQVEFQQVYERVRRGELVQTFDTVRLRKDGRPIPVSVTASLITDAGGRVTGISAIIRDISTRKRIEEALRANEAKFRSFVESSPDAIVIVDQRGQIRLVNSQADRLFGYRREELYGEPLELLLPQRYRRRIASELEKLSSAPQVQPMRAGLELFGRRKTGGEVPVEINFSSLQTEAGVLVCSTIRDTTSRQQVELARARLAAIVESSCDAIISARLDQVVVSWNQAAERMYGYTADEMIGRLLSVVVPPERMDEFERMLEHIQREESLQPFETVRVRKDGQRIAVSVTDSPLKDLAGRIMGFSDVGRDLGERKRLEGEILQASEREQRRIAEDLHDGLGQQLAGISCLSDTLKQNLAERASPDAATAARISKLLDSAVAQTRTLARGLYPVAPEPSGLITCLKELAENISDLFKVTCLFDCPEPVLIEDNAVATHLCRIAQEAVTNALKHGRAQRVEIGLSSTPEQIILTVRDNGVGFRKNESLQRGLGLRIMNYRAGMIGGTFAIQKKTGGGTEVICTVPKTSAPRSAVRLESVNE